MPEKHSSLYSPLVSMIKYYKLCSLLNLKNKIKQNTVELECFSGIFHIVCLHVLDQEYLYCF